LKTVTDVNTAVSTPPAAGTYAAMPASLHGQLVASRAVHFSPELREAVAAGRITISFRLWQRPKVKIGGRYRTAGVVIEVDDIDLIPFGAISAGDVRRSGERDRETLRARAAHSGPIDDDTLVYRIEFHVAADER
jgi:hypothetical protein